MNKKFLNLSILTLLVIMLLVLTGCGKNDKSEKSQDTNTKEEASVTYNFNEEELNYSNVNTSSNLIGTKVDYKPETKTDFNPGKYEGIRFKDDEDFPGDINNGAVESDNLEWIVLAEDGENVLITTTEPVQPYVVIYGPDGYNNSVQALNAYCAKYFSGTVNGKEYTARSMNLDDVEALYIDKSDNWKQTRTNDRFAYPDNTYGKSGFKCQSADSYPAIYALEKDSGIGGNLGRSEAPNGYEPYNNSYTEDSRSTESYVSTFYYVPENEYKTNFDSKVAEILLETEDDYWLASRAVSVNESTASFRTNFISSKGELRAYDFTTAIGSWAGDSHFVRPVVVIPKADLGL